VSSDTIAVTGIEAFGYHGVLEEERTHGQRFVVDLLVFTDVTDAANQDDVASTVDYSQLALRAKEIAEGEHCDLIETVASRIADALLSFPRVDGIRVTVHKPNAPVGTAVADVSVSVERHR
jgi:dihydroneopterin aldolase